MIYITGDTHGEQGRFAANNMGDKDWKREDYLIICGDFGFVSNSDKAKQAFLNYLEEEKPYTICFCEGNHEEFPAIYSYPVEEWNGGKIHRIRKNIIHLMRGQIYQIENKSFFVFGGAYSIDRLYRKEGVSWWKEEQPSAIEYNVGMENLQKHSFKVDYVITHTAPQAIIYDMIEHQPWSVRLRFKMDHNDYRLQGYLGEVQFKTDYKGWFFGHFHFDTIIDEKHIAVHYEVHKLP